MFERFFRRPPADPPMDGLVLETSAACQLQCPFCFLRSYSERPDPNLMPLAVVEAVEPYLSGLESIDLTGWGEPLLNPRLFEIIALIRSNFSGRLTMTTNGMLLDRAASDRLIAARFDTVCVSMDAASADSYRRARPGGEWDRLTANLRAFAAARPAGRPLLFGAFLLRAGLGLDGAIFQQLTGVFNRAGLDAACHRDYYRNPFDPSALARAMAEATAAAPAGFTLVLPESIGDCRTGNCGGFQLTRPFVTASGLVSVCCAMAYPCALMRRDGAVERTPAVTFGDVRRTPLPEIWAGADYAGVRAEIRSGAAPAACGDCIALYLRPGEIIT